MGRMWLAQTRMEWLWKVFCEWEALLPRFSVFREVSQSSSGCGGKNTDFGVGKAFGVPALPLQTACLTLDKLCNWCRYKKQFGTRNGARGCHLNAQEARRGSWARDHPGVEEEGKGSLEGILDFVKGWELFESIFTSIKCIWDAEKAPEVCSPISFYRYL